MLNHSTVRAVCSHCTETATCTSQLQSVQSKKTQATAALSGPKPDHLSSLLCTQVEDASLSAVSELVLPLSSTTSRYSCDDGDTLDYSSSGVELFDLSLSGDVKLMEAAAVKVSSVEILMGLAGSEGFTGYTAAQVGSIRVVSGAT